MHRFSALIVLLLFPIGAQAQSTNLLDYLELQYSAPEGADVPSVYIGSGSTTEFTGDGIPELITLTRDAAGMPSMMHVIDGTINQEVLAIDIQALRQSLVSMGFFNVFDDPFLGFFGFVDIGENSRGALFLVNDVPVLAGITLLPVGGIIAANPEEWRFVGLVDFSGGGDDPEWLLYDKLNKRYRSFGRCYCNPG